MSESSGIVLISGASGFVGRALVARLSATGYETRRLVRGPVESPGDVPWDPARGELDPRALEGVDAIVHLAGEAIDHRWTAERKRAILESRVSGTTLLSTAIASLERKPRVMVSASAIGYYGGQGDAPLDESSPKGDGFLADVVEAWEGAAEPARAAGIRVAHPRFGLILNPEGGVLARLLPIFNLGGGGRIGSGDQVMSWIARDDLLRAIEFLIARDDLSGPVNLTAPAPVTNAEFAHTLGRVLHRPAVTVVPEFAVKLAFGEMGEQTVLASQRAMPRALLHHGFIFEWPTLEQALRHEMRSAD